MYNQRDAPTMSYVPQLCEVNKDVAKEELLTHTKGFPSPTQRLPKTIILLPPRSRVPKIIPLAVTSKAALIRTAYRTCTVWRDELKRINDIRYEYAPLKHFGHTPDAISRSENKWWKSPAFVDSLFNATKYVIGNKTKITKPTGKRAERLPSQHCQANRRQYPHQ